MNLFWPSCRGRRPPTLDGVWALFLLVRLPLLPRSEALPIFSLHHHLPSVFTSATINILHIKIYLHLCCCTKITFTVINHRFHHLLSESYIRTRPLKNAYIFSHQSFLRIWYIHMCLCFYRIFHYFFCSTSRRVTSLDIHSNKLPRETWRL